MGLILEVSSGRTILSPAVIAAKIALRSRTRAEGKLGNGCATISTGPVSIYHGSLKPSLVFLFHSIFEVQLDFKKNLDVTSSVATLFAGGNCTPTLVQRKLYPISSFLSREEQDLLGVFAAFQDVWSKYT